MVSSRSRRARQRPAAFLAAALLVGFACWLLRPGFADEETAPAHLVTGPNQALPELPPTAPPALTPAPFLARQEDPGASLSAPETTAVRRLTGTVSGVVRLQNGTPLGGVSISAFPQRYERFSHAHRERPPLGAALTTTDSSGTFVLHKLPLDERLRLLHALPGYAPGTGQLVTLTVDRPERSLAVVLTGQAVRGQVVDAEGHGVAGAKLAAGRIFTQPSDRDPAPPWPDWRKLSCDEEGRFSIWLKDQDFPTTLRASGPGHTFGQTQLLTRPDGPITLTMQATASLSGRVLVAGLPIRAYQHAAPQEYDHDPCLTGVLLQIGTLHHHSAVEIAPLPEVTQLLLGEAASRALGEVPDPSRFLIRGVTSSELQLCVRSPSAPPQTRSFDDLHLGRHRDVVIDLQAGACLDAVILKADGSPYASQALSLLETLSGSGPKGTARDLRRQTDAAGRLCLRDLRPHSSVRLEDPVPTENAELGAAGSTTLHTWRLRPMARLQVGARDAEGKKPHHFLVTAAWSGPEGYRAESFWLDQDETISLPAGRIALALGEHWGHELLRESPWIGANATLGEGCRQQPDLLNLVLRPDQLHVASLAALEPGRLEVLVSADGLPVADARVELLPRSGAHYLTSALPTGFTDDRGRAFLSGIPPMDLQVLVAPKAAGHAQTRHRLLMLPGAQESLQVSLPSGEVHGRLVDSRSGAPIPGVSLELLQTDPEAPVATHTADCKSDAEGRFRLRYVAPGSAWRLASFHADYGSTRQTVRPLTAGEMRELGTFSLEGRGELVIAFVNRPPGSELVVTLRSADDPTHAARWTRCYPEQAFATFQRLPEGPWLLAACVCPQGAVLAEDPTAPFALTEGLPLQRVSVGYPGPSEAVLTITR